ncbi:LysR substrate-binding domain-containing protein [Pararhodobacter sp. CCB-MM2]|uniref:LysR substrate-binding domain-containing protein n=1 Tax=Pararhodobacter sp. CCB-MM2 TaxID=1786003 RepID=UPI001111AA4E|nr:LysR substrate-binding domain-containing protein [Pararhodobacter sp. CCB-MM2]
MTSSIRRQISSPMALFVFEAVARRGSFQAAAGELNVTQPSISYQIRELEAHLGRRLFERRGRGIVLTEDGRTLARAVGEGFASIEAGLAEIAHRADGNLVTLCLSSSAAANFLLPRFPRLRAQIPDLDLSIRIVSRDVTPAAEGADFAIRLGHADWPDLDAWRLFDEVYFPLCAPDHFAALGRPATLEDIATADLLFLRERDRERDDWRRFFDHLGRPLGKVKDRLTFDDQQALIACAVDGQGVALGWLGMTDHQRRQGSLIRPVSEAVTTGRGFHLVASKGMRLSPMARHFRDWLTAEGAAIQRDWEAES